MGEMKNQHAFLLLILLFAISVAEASPPLTISSHCPSKCGNVTIPYPFGSKRRDCFFDEWYEVVCQDGIPRLKKMGLEIYNISLDSFVGTPTLNVSVPITHSKGTCGSGNAATLFRQLEGSPFFVHVIHSVLAAFGCNIQVSLKDNMSDIVGCNSVCNSNNSALSYCSGTDGCCFARLQNLRMQSVNVVFQFKDGDDAAQLSSVDTCRNASAFFVEDVWLSEMKNNIEYLKVKEEVPVILQWGMPNTTGFIVNHHKDSSTCHFDDDNGISYCVCEKNFEGNSFIPSGCQDIDECADPTLNNCTHGCVNTRGGYSCMDRERTLEVVLIAVCGVIGVVLLIGLGLLIHKVVKNRKKMQLRRKYFKRNGGLLLQQQLSSAEGNGDKGRLFVMKELDAATDNFSSNRVLGRGGQGTVYKGMLADGRTIAVKQPVGLVFDEDNVKPFINEIYILSQISHRNVVQMLGCCLESECPIMVYEFIPNGTLSEYLAGAAGVPIPWNIRLKIATQVAGAISYMHFAASIPIYHRDIKSSNILLDANYQAKVADFGISRVVSFNNTHLTTSVQGTFGYLDPEFFQSGQYTDKSDVYSFGVVLVELLTSKKPILEEQGMAIGLAALFLTSMEDNTLLDILDPELLNLESEIMNEEVMVVASLAKQCLLSRRNRPTMKQVAMELDGIRKQLPHPACVEEISDIEDDDDDDDDDDDNDMLRWAELLMESRLDISRTLSESDAILYTQF